MIDAELLLKRIVESREKNPHEDSKIRVNHTIEHDHIAQLVLEQPAAYDVDRVVEQIGEYAHSKICDRHGDCPYVDNKDVLCVNCGAMGTLEIVRSGGVQYPESAHTDIGNETVNWKEHMEDRFNRFE